MPRHHRLRDFMAAEGPESSNAMDFVNTVLDVGGDEECAEPTLMDLPEIRYKSKNLEAEEGGGGTSSTTSSLLSDLSFLRSQRHCIASNMSKESTLTDAIDYIKQLQVEVMDLQTELSSMPDEEVEKQGSISSTNTMAPPDPIHCQRKVELSPMGHNKFLLKITCENRRGGFTKLVEVINSLGFEVTNVSSVAFSYVSQSVFFIEPKDGVTASMMSELKEFVSAFVGASEEP
ncbi:hypothetical protein J5N97_011632 [Dioscorea zingiberensis]|uniref:Plant bHLH transcription factor ACT-like domain-containing protein n=1 Tax=Dioscorea zingiberensis TaxID=325984 RepID=A0A9D5D2T3_9LILI|nr:hypothetical protein J5N97_011632 [Dioscorea zingiberensis]